MEKTMNPRKRRSFSREFLLSDEFMKLSVRSRWLYFCLVLAADDEGFVSSPDLEIHRSQSTAKEMQELLKSGFVHIFETGPALILHWYLHSSLRQDRYRETAFQQEKALVELGPDKVYTPKQAKKAAKPKAEPQKQESKQFVKPTLDEVRSFIREKGFSVDADAWYAHYESNGWMVGKNKMKSWQASINYWQHNNSNSTKKGKEENFGPKYGVAYSELQPKWDTSDLVISYGNESFG